MQNKTKTLLIYNPHAGKKRRMLPMQTMVSLEEIDQLMKQYQIMVDYAPTEYPGHATELARKAVKKGYSLVIAAGGDGTLSETLAGLIHTNVTLAILPLGSFMNVARMLAIPRDLEKAIQLIKIGRTRKIDVGKVVELDGVTVTDPHYFLEEAGIGAEAQFHYYTLKILEFGQLWHIVDFFKMIFGFYAHKAHVFLDDHPMETRATMVTIANGPFTGAALHLSPEARLNDHKLTVSFYNMSKWQLTRYLFGLFFRGRAIEHPQIQTAQASKVRIVSKTKRWVHMDARIYGKTPVSLEIVPNAVNMITGFPTESSALKKRTFLDP